jgi:hypothetical protein
MIRVIAREGARDNHGECDMKRMLAAAIVLAGTLGGVAAHATPTPFCSAPVSTNCYENDPANNYPFCTVYADTSGTGVVNGVFCVDVQKG